MVWVIVIHLCAYFIFPDPKCKLCAGKDCILHLLAVSFIESAILEYMLYARHCARLWGQVHE